MKTKIKAKTATIAALTLLLSSTSALADDSTKAQIAALQQQIEQLQTQLNLVQRKLEVSEEIDKSNAEKFATVEYNNKGLNITSPDKKYGLKVRGYAQADSRNYLSDDNGEVDQFIVRSARPSLEFKFPHNFSAKIVTDFGNNQTRLIDGYADWKANDILNVRAGKFKTPVGLERWQGETEVLFVERGLTTNLVPFRDIGVGAFGEIIPQTLEYQLALTNGAADLGDSNSDSSGSKDFSGRVFAQPFKNSSTPWLQGLGFGVAGSVGQKDGSTTNSELSSGYKTTAQNNFFTYTTGTFGDGKSTRVNPQAWYYNGPLSLLGEYVISKNEVTRSTFHDDLKNDAWTAIATYVLTGEDAAFDGVKPSADFNPEKGNWGALELAGRVGKLNIDDDTYPNFASSTASASSIEEKIIGLNWYLNQNLKINFDYAQNSFENGATAGDRPDEQVFLTRVQFKF